MNQYFVRDNVNTNAIAAQPRTMPTLHPQEVLKGRRFAQHYTTELDGIRMTALLD